MARVIFIILLLLGAFALPAQKNLKADSTRQVLEKNFLDSVDSKAQVVGEDLKQGPTEIVDYFSTSKIVYTLFILFIAFAATKILIKILEVWAERNANYRITIKGLIPVLRMFIWISAIVFIISFIFQPPLATVLAFSASVGVAIGFAAQDLLKNIFGGITILFDRPFQVGDKVDIDGNYGEIVEVGLRSTRMRTVDDNVISIPNGTLMNDAVSNANTSEQNCQVNTTMYLPLDFDIDHAKSVAKEAVKVSRYIYLNKPINVFFKQAVIGQKVFLQMDVRAYVNDIRNEVSFRSEITEVLSKLLLVKDRPDKN